MSSPALLTEITDHLGVAQDELSLAVEAELRRRRESELYLAEPYLFHREILCPENLKSYLRPFHKDGLEWLHNPLRKRLKLILWPRGHLKSTIFTQGESTRLATQNPNIRILINSYKVELAQPMLASIKGYLNSERYRALYGNMLPNTKSGKEFRNNLQELTFLSRTDLSLKEATITCSGLEASKTSQHYDWIFHDDLVNRENIGTFEAMDKVWKIWQDSMDLLEPGGTMVVIGTRWHPLDLYGRILSDYVDSRCFNGQTTQHVKNCACQFDVNVLVLRDEYGKYIFDSKFDDNVAKQLLSIKGQREFSAQYENNPASPDAVWFKKEEIDSSLVESEEIEALRDRLIWYMIVDPAESLEARSSFTAVICVGIDPETGVLYVDFATQARVDTAGFVNLIFQAHQEMNPHYFFMEKTTRKALEFVLKDKMALFGRYFSIGEVNPVLGRQAHAKETRIRSLRPLFENGRIKINRELRDLLSILYTIPSSSTYDLADALSYILQVAPQGVAGGNLKKDALPVKVMQNRGIQYAARRARPIIATSDQEGRGGRITNRSALRCIYTSARSRPRRKVRPRAPVRATVERVNELHEHDQPKNDRTVQKVS